MSASKESGFIVGEQVSPVSDAEIDKKTDETKQPRQLDISRCVQTGRGLPTDWRAQDNANTFSVQPEKDNA